MEHFLGNLDDFLRGWLYVAFVTASALVLYFGVTVKVGMARSKYGVKAPATSGHPDFERYFRVQMNTLEQLVLFLPSLWLFAGVSGKPKLAALLGVVWIAGRVLYAKGYYQAAEKRAQGFIISVMATAIMLIASLLGLLYKII